MEVVQYTPVPFQAGTALKLSWKGKGHCIKCETCALSLKASCFLKVVSAKDSPTVMVSWWLGSLCCLPRKDTLLSQCLSSQVYWWVPVKLMLELRLRLTSIPSREDRNNPGRFKPQKRDKLRADEPLGSYALSTFTLPTTRQIIIINLELWFSELEYENVLQNGWIKSGLMYV